MRFLAIGECMAELSPSDQGGEFKLGFAGDTFNTTWYLAQIAPELDVSYLTAIGDDAISRDMRTFIMASGINDAHVQELPGETVGLYLIHLDKGERSFSYWRGQSAAKKLAQDPMSLQRATEQADLIYFSGITLAILDAASRDTLFDVLRKVRSAGKIVAFDTNLRPGLWTSAKVMQDTIMRAAGEADIVLPSFEDEEQWFGDDTAVATLDRYAKLGTKKIIVKNSDRSVVYEEDGRRGEVTVEPAPYVVDTTAAGDSFNAAVFASLLTGKNLAEGIQDGCHLARHVVRQKGALVPVGDALAIRP